MWHKKSILKFLEDSNIEPGIVGAIKIRIVEVSEKKGVLKGTFSSSKLEYVMGNPELARKYEEADKTNPDLQLAGFC